MASDYISCPVSSVCRKKLSHRQNTVFLSIESGFHTLLRFSFLNTTERGKYETTYSFHIFRFLGCMLCRNGNVSQKYILRITHSALTPLYANADYHLDIDEGHNFTLCGSSLLYLLQFSISFAQGPVLPIEFNIRPSVISFNTTYFSPTVQLQISFYAFYLPKTPFVHSRDAFHTRHVF